MRCMYTLAPSILESLSSAYFTSFGKIISLPEYSNLTAEDNSKRLSAADLAVDILEVLEIYVDEFRKALIYDGQRYPYVVKKIPKTSYVPLTNTDKGKIELLLNNRSEYAGRMNTILNCLGYVVSDKEGAWKIYYMGYDNASLIAKLGL